MDEVKKNTGNEKKKYGLLLNMDPNIPVLFFPNRPELKDIYDVIDRISLGKIDFFSYCIFAEGLSHIKDSRYTEPHPYSYERYKPFYDRGIDPLEVIIRRCHEQGIRFLACYRMNDRHPHTKGRFQEENPQWQLWPDGGVYDKGAMDFSYREVRDWMVNVVKETLGKYDVDGIEFDYMRWCHVFLPSKAQEQAPLLTEFMREIRTLLDEEGALKGRKLTFSARIPQRLKDADMLGYDVAAWVKEGLVDIICPSDFMYTDYNAAYEEFTELARQTGCSVYPSIHPMIARLISGALLSEAQYRAIAERMYAAGADGLSLYNFQYHWEQCAHLAYPGIPSNYTDIFKFIGSLKEPQTLAKETRHYIFYPLWEEAVNSTDSSIHRISGDAVSTTSVKGFEGAARMLLIERDEKDIRKPFVFYLGMDDCIGENNWQLLFNAANLTDEDRFDLDINGKKVDPIDIQAKYYPEGLNVSHRRPLCPYLKVRIFLGGFPLKQGLNELGFTLRKCDPAVSLRIELQEVEVIIDP